MTSEDVIHSFFVPAFRVKQDVVPGRYTTVWFEATKVGHLPSLLHRVLRLPPLADDRLGDRHGADEYQAWLSGGGTAGAPEDLGAALFEQYICNTCHFEDDSGRGPSLIGIYGSGSAAGRRHHPRARRRLPARASILNPAAHVAEGYLQIMPTYQGQLSEVSLLQLIAYVKSLGDEAEDDTPQASRTCKATATRRRGVEGP